MEWISVKDRLPEEGESVLVFMDGKIEVARIEKGISKEQREKMKSGELPDKEEFAYIPGRPFFAVKRTGGWSTTCCPGRWILVR